MKKKSEKWAYFLAALPQAWGGNCVDSATGVAKIQGLECLFANILRSATTVAGLGFGLMLIVGGFKLIIAGGDPKGVQSASKTLTTAVVGLILTVAAWFILQLIEHFTGLKVTEFKIPV